MSENLMSKAVSHLDAVVFVDNIDAGYLPGINILNNCSLTAHDGELVGIIGPNGAGKSTVIEIIAAVLGLNAEGVGAAGRSWA